VDGKGTFTPNTDFTGQDTFLIPVEDARGGVGMKRIIVSIKEGVKDDKSFRTVRDEGPFQDPIHIPVGRALGIIELDSDIEMSSAFKLYQGETEITSQASGNIFTGTYGTFSIRSNGRWKYELNTNNEMVNALSGDNQEITDTNSLKDTLAVEFRRTLDDGEIIRFGHVIEITILGTAKVAD